MYDRSYVDLREVKIPPIERNTIRYAIVGKSLWMWQLHKFSNKDMALMLLDILYQNKALNEATYRKIMNKYNRQERTA